jgi:isopropylmalate/homocitrate/citramalate synthase
VQQQQANLLPKGKELETPWKTEHWWTSPYDFADDVRKNAQFSLPIELHDVTLRDGEQTPGVVFSKEDKFRIAMKLDEARVQRIEAGMPVVSEEDKLAIKEIAKNVTFSRVFSFARARKQDIDAALSCDVSSVVIEIPVLKERLEVMGTTVEKAATDAMEVIDYAKSHGMFVVFFPFDTTRADINSIRVMMKAGESAHADRLAVVDTMSAASPQGFAYLVCKVKEMVSIPLEVHCHNSLSLGVANTLAGLSAGAKAAHVSINGIGESAGNVALEEVVMALLLLYGIDCNVDIQKLREASKLVEDLSNIPIPVNKPVLGRNIFRRESGIAVERYYKMPELARQLELFDPKWFADETEIVLGKKSGKYSIMYHLRKRGLEASEDQINQILQQVKQKSIAKKNLVTDSEFDQIISVVLNGKSGK